MDQIQALAELMKLESRDDITDLVGEIITTPSLLIGAGGGPPGLIYACDVRIPGYDLPLLSVPLANANRDILYATPGNAVTLKRNPQAGGRFEITGFAKRKPGTRRRVAVDVENMVVGNSENRAVTGRMFTYGDLGDPNYGIGYGYVPYGAYGIFEGDQLAVVRSGA